MPVELQWLDVARAMECAVCGFDGTGVQVAEVNALGRVGIEVVRCPACASVRMSGEVGDVTPDDASIDAYVEAGAGIEAIASGLAVPRPHQVRRMLDVGCNYGFGLDLGRHLYGWQTVGVEPSPAGVRGAQELDLDIRAEYVTDSTQFDELFDIVLASEVLEHVPDPTAFLRTLARLLTPSGILVLTTPAAEAVDPGNADEMVLIALSPGFHGFLASAEGLERLLDAAGFASISVRRDGGTLRARAALAPDLELEAGGAPDPVAIEGYYDARAASAPSGSALANGMATRHLRSTVNRGDWAAAEASAPRAIAALRERHGFDLDEPASVATALRSGAVPAWNLVGATYSLGMLELLGRGRSDRAAEYFDLVLVAISAWRAYAGLLDGDSANLRPHAARHRALAVARSRPADAAAAFLDSAGLLDEQSTTLLRLQIFVELVTAGQQTWATPLVAGVSATATAAATSDDADLRRSGRDALYCLATSAAAAGDLTASREWSRIARAALDDADPTSDVLRAGLDAHDATLAELLAAASVDPTPETSIPPAHGLETYWVDASGVYLQGWAHHGRDAVTSIALHRRDAHVRQEPTPRPDLAQFWPGVPAVTRSGFALYLPGAPDGPLDLEVTTADGALRVRLELPTGPLPAPRWAGSGPIGEFLATLTEQVTAAPPGPALAIGLRGHDSEQAQDLRTVLGGRQLVVADIHPGPGVDVLADAHDLAGAFGAHHFSLVSSQMVLEHLTAPWLMAAQTNHVLAVGGITAHVAPVAWPEHAQPNDFWRFTTSGLRELFGPRTGFEVIADGVSADVRLHPTGDWLAQHRGMPTLPTPACAWVIARKVRDLTDDEVRWPYSAAEGLAQARQYPVDGIAPVESLVRLVVPVADGGSLHRGGAATDEPATPPPTVEGAPDAQRAGAPEAADSPTTPVADVSVILPLYNGARYVAAAVRSIVAQTLLPAQLVVIDDGSTDGGVEVVLGMDLPFPLTVVTQRNQGQSAARNAGIAVATGELLAFIDQDDQWRRAHLETLVPLLAEDAEVGWVYSDFDEVDGEGRTITHSFIREVGIPQPKNSLVACVSGDLMALPSASVLRRAAVVEVGGFDPALRGYEDDDLFVRMFTAGWDHRFVPVATTRYRVHVGGSSSDLSFLRSRMHYLDTLVRMLTVDHRLNRDLLHDVVLPRFFQSTLSEYTQAIAMREYGRAVTLAEALRRIAGMEEKHGWRRRAELRLIGHPRRMRWVLLRVARLPRWLQPRLNPDLDLRTRTAVRAELRRR